MVDNKTGTQDLEELTRKWNEWKAERAERERKWERFERDRKRGRKCPTQRYAYTSGHPFQESFLESSLESAAKCCATEIGRLLGTKLAAVLLRPSNQKPVYVPVMAETTNAVMPEEMIALKTPRQYEHPFLVQAHLMNLSGGRKASPEKQRAAGDYGFVLREDQTWVKAYTKGVNDP